MKELKYNLNLLYNKKELYYCILGIILINAIHVFLVINRYYAGAILKTAEYQFILYNNEVIVTSLLILAFPVLTSLALSDVNWNEKHNASYICLYPRLNLRRNIWTRLFLAILVTFVVCFLGFMLNYISLCFIAGSGNEIINFQSTPYNLVLDKAFFLDSVRFSNPVLFTILISLHVSLLYALLAGISYTLSFFTRQKIVIYFQVLLIMILVEVGFSFLSLGDYSIVKQLQPFSLFEFYQSFIVYVMLFVIAVVPLVFINKRKDHL